jgi:ribose 5-phosphate isomerase B
MKRFQIITEADARVLEPGSTVVLVTGGHITPLAADTLRERRVEVIRDQLDVDVAARAPRADVRTVAIGGDHGSLAMKAAILKHLREQGRAVDDLGTHSTDPVDYPDTAAAVAVQVARGEADAGIVIDGAGLGSAIAANKVKGVRAAMCTDRTLARYAREHNGANVLSLGATLLGIEAAIEIVDVFLGTAMREPRYIRRLAKLKELERRSRV